MENSHEKNQRIKKKKKDRKFHSLVVCACAFFVKIKKINKTRKETKGLA